MATTGIVQGAYAAMVQVTDGSSNVSIISLAQYNADPTGLTITGILKGGYEEVIVNSNDEVKPLSKHVQAPGGHTIARTMSTGYKSLIQEDGSGLSSLPEAIATAEAAE